MKFSITGLLFSTLIFFSAIASAEDCSQAKDGAQALSEEAANILKQTQIDAVRKDPRDFCQRNMMIRALNSNRFTPTDIGTISTEELKTDKYMVPVEKTMDKDQGHGWNFSLIPNQKNRELSFLLSAEDRGETYSREQIPDSIAQFVKEGRSTFAKAEDSSAFDCSSDPNEIPSSNTDNLGRHCRYLRPLMMPDSTKDDIERRFACLEQTIHVINCTDALKKTQQIMAPHDIDGDPKFIALPLWNKILSNPKYNEGLRLASLTILDRLDGKPFEKNANIFSDLQNAFQKSGMKPSEATDASFDVMGLIGTSSGNLSSRLEELQLKNQKTKALSMIAASLALLDYNKSTKGHGTLYSLPASVSSTCDNAKTYHFWMSAYISRALAKEGVDEKSAAIAPFIAEKGYQVARDLGFKGAANMLISKQPYDPLHQVQRMDLNFAAAGAEFGARSVKSGETTLDLDKSLTSMIENSNVVTPPSKEDAKRMSLPFAYTKWKQEVSPNDAFNFVDKQAHSPPNN